LQTRTGDGDESDRNKRFGWMDFGWTDFLFILARAFFAGILWVSITLTAMLHARVPLLDFLDLLQKKSLSRFSDSSLEQKFNEPSPDPR